MAETEFQTDTIIVGQAAAVCPFQGAILWSRKEWEQNGGDPRR